MVRDKALTLSGSVVIYSLNNNIYGELPSNIKRSYSHIRGIRPDYIFVDDVETFDEDFINTILTLVGPKIYLTGSYTGLLRTLYHTPGWDTYDLSDNI
jgi:hypothetical protein